METPTENTYGDRLPEHLGANLYGAIHQPLSAPEFPSAKGRPVWVAERNSKEVSKRTDETEHARCAG